MNGQAVAYVKSIVATTPIFGDEIIHKLDNKFIDSEWMATYEEGIAPEITWDRSLDGREHYTRTEDYDDGAYATQVIVKMSDIVPSDEELKAATIEFVVRSPVDGGVASKAVADLWPLMESTDRITEKYIKVAYIEREDDGYTTLDLALVIKEETNASEIFDAPEIQAVLTPGVYFYDYKANSSIVSLEFYPKKLTVSGPGLAPIPVPEKFLPTTVPVIKTATPGQTIVVKSVDDSGKPTEWEAVDLPDSSQNATLTFTGAVEATYDGSEPVEVEIPSGSEMTLLGTYVLTPSDKKLWLDLASYGCKNFFAKYVMPVKPATSTDIYVKNSANIGDKILQVTSPFWGFGYYHIMDDVVYGETHLNTGYGGIGNSWVNGLTRNTSANKTSIIVEFYPYIEGTEQLIIELWGC